MLEELKKQAAYQACNLIKDKMYVGLGTGSTAAWVVRKLGERIKEEKLDIIAVATSNATEELAKQYGIKLVDINEVDHLDIVIDGADEIELETLNLIKGHGGALFREKMVACLTKHFVVVADETKKVSFIGEHMSLPIEVVPFGWKKTRDKILSLGVTSVERREEKDGKAYLTDNGNMILNCLFPRDLSVLELQTALKNTIGVVDHGLFLGMAVEAFVASKNGVELLRRTC